MLKYGLFGSFLKDVDYKVFFYNFANLNDNINQSNFYKNKKIFMIDDIDVNEILVSKTETYGKKSSFKYFVGYNDNDDIRPLFIKLSQMIGYTKYFNSNKTTSLSRFLIKSY